jgi:hypothetical protein
VIPDKSLQHWITHGTRDQADWQRSGSSSHVLGEALRHDRKRRDRSAEDGLPQGEHGRAGPSLLQIREKGRWDAEGLCGDQVFRSPVCRKSQLDKVQQVMMALKYVTKQVQVVEWLETNVFALAVKTNQ